jgi:hypothetical protein
MLAKIFSFFWKKLDSFKEEKLVKFCEGRSFKDNLMELKHLLSKEVRDKGRLSQITWEKLKPKVALQLKI